MAVGYFSEEDTLILDQTIESDFAIFCDDKKVSIVVCKFK